MEYERIIITPFHEDFEAEDPKGFEMRSLSSEKRAIHPA